MAKQYIQAPGSTPITGGTISTPTSGVSSSAPTSLATGPRQLQRLTLALGAGATLPVMVAGDFFFVEEIVYRGDTPQPVSVSFDEGPFISVATRQTEVRAPSIFTKAQLYNPGATYGMTVTVVVGFGGFAQTEHPWLARSFSKSFEITRPANVTPYAANQMVADVVPGRFIFSDVFRAGSNTAVIRRARFTKNSVTITDAVFKLFLTRAGTQVCESLVDQDAFQQTYARFPGGLGVIDFPAFMAGGAGSDCAECVVDDFEMTIRTNYFSGSNDVWGYLVALAPYVPASGEKMTIELNGIQL